MKLRKSLSCLLAVMMLVGLLSAFPWTAALAAEPGAEDGLVVYTNFDDAYVLGGKVLDLSGRGNHGAINGDVKWVDGIRGKAAWFDNANAGEDSGTGTDFINFGKNEDVLFGTDSFTVSVWVKVIGNQTNTAIVSNKAYGSGANTGFAIGNIGGTEGGLPKGIVSNINTVGGSRADLNAKTPNAKDGEWHMITAVYERGVGMRIYEDGALTGTNTAFAGHTGSVDTGLDLVVGAGGDKCNALKDVYVDELRVYKKALTDARVAELYDEVKDDVAPADALVLYTDFEEVVDGKVLDLSGYGNHGTIEGNVAFIGGSGVNGKGMAAYISNPAKNGAASWQYIDFGKDASTQLGEGNFTISAWVKTEDGGAHDTAIFGNKNYATGANQGIALNNQYANADQQVCWNFTAAGGGRKDLRGMMGLDGEWHMQTLVVDRAGKASAYMDGVLVKDLDVTGATGTYDTGSSWRLGADSRPGEATDKTWVDELRLYKTALSAADVKALYDAVYEEPQEPDPVDIADGLALYTDFEEVAESTVPDLTGNGNNGVVTGDVTFAENSGVAGRGTAAYIVNINKRAPTQYVDFGRDESIRLGTGDFSVSLWIKFEDGVFHNDSSIFSQRDYDSGSSVGFTLGNQSSGSARIVANIGNGSQRRERQGMEAVDGEWHHLAASVSRSGDIVTYVDGKATTSQWHSASVAMSNFTASLDAGFPWVLGADGKYDFASTNLYADNLRLYTKAVDKDTVEMIYAVEGGEIEIDGMLALVADMEPSSRWPQDAIDQLALTLTQGKETFAAAEDAAKPAILEELRAAYQAFLQGARGTVNMHVISDVQAASNAEFATGLNDMKALDPNAVFISAGDLTSGGSADEVDGYFNTYDSNIPVSAGNTFHLMGNHDYRGPSNNSGLWTNDVALFDATVEGGATPYYAARAAKYLSRNAPYMPETDGKVYFDKWINGYHFIVMNTEKGIKDAAWISQEQIAWLGETLAEGADADKPIFVVNHQQLDDTHWRSNCLAGFGLQDAQIKALFKQYPQVVYITGHIHNGFGYTDVQDREFGLMVDLPSYQNTENGVGGKGSGYYVSVYDDEIVFRARNYLTGTWLPQYDVSVGFPTLPMLYQQAKAKDAANYTQESWEKVADLVAEAEQDIMNLQYQNNDTSAGVPPAEGQLYTPALRARTNALTKELKAALDSLETVTPGPDEIDLALLEDTYLQAGTDADKTPTAYDNYNANVIRIKNSNGVQTYTRKALLAFDLAEASAALDGAKIQLTVSGGNNPEKDFARLQVYTVPATWSTATVTWNNLPEATKVGDAYEADIRDGVMTVDVSDVVSAAVEAGQEKIAFVLGPVDEPQHENGINFFSSRDASGNGPALTQYKKSGGGREEDPDFQQIRLAWTDYLLGGDFDETDPGLAGYIDALNESANEYWQEMVKSDVADRSRLWQDLDLTPIMGTSETAKARSGNISTAYYRLRDLTLAYKIKGTTLYQNPAVKNEVIQGLDFMYAKSYNENAASTPVFGNWWHWEIGTPVASLTTAMLLYDDLTDQQLRNYTNAVNRYCASIASSGMPGSPTMTGANLIDKGTAVALSALLSQNANKMDHVKAKFKEVFEYVTTGDGFYKDGSYIQHQALAFMGAYGKDLYNKLSIFFIAFDGSPWELAYEDGCEMIPFNGVFDSVEPFFYNGLYMDMVSGRDIVRQSKTDKARGAQILSAILPMGSVMPTEEMQARFDSMAKAMLQVDPEYFFANCDNITAAATASRILQDDTIVPRSDYSLNKVFTMDKAVYHSGSYALAISMSSTRTYGHELINDEGKQTWNIGDGMTYLYLPDELDQYGGGYWATIDPTRLAGTTVEHKVHAKGAMDRRYNKFDWVGGSTLGSYAAVGMQNQAVGSSTTNRDGAVANKSWFVFGDEIVALGSGITSTLGNTVETIVDNRRIQPEDITGFTVNVNGEQKNLYTNVNAGVELEDTSYLYLPGKGGGIGYYFPGTATIKGLTETRTGNWNSQGANTGEAVASYATFWFDHGVSPTNASYEYVILPGKGEADVAAYAQSNDVEILANTTQVQAARKASLGVTTANFWAANAPAVGGVSTDKPASVTMVKDAEAGTITVAVSDPTQKNAVINVTLGATATEVVEKADNITVAQQNPIIQFSVDTAGLEGGTSSVTFRYDPNADVELAEVQQPDTLKVAMYTRFKDLPLPATVKAMANDGETYDIPVTWAAGDYNRATYGVYTLEGALNLPAGIANSANLVAAMRVQVGELETATVNDMYFRGGTYGDDEPYVDGLLVMKNESNQSYVRKSLVRFELDDVPKNLDRAYFLFELSGMPSADFSRASIYRVSNDWDAATATYNTYPARIDNAPVAEFTIADLNANGLVVKLDVTDAVKAALEAGETGISFEMSIPTTNGQNYTNIYSSRTTVAGAQKPALAWEKDPAEVVPDELNCEYLIRVAEDIDPAAYTNVDTEALQAAINKMKAVMADQGSTALELAQAEAELNSLLLDLRRVPQPRRKA